MSKRRKGQIMMAEKGEPWVSLHIPLETSRDVLAFLHTQLRPIDLQSDSGRKNFGPLFDDWREANAKAASKQ